MLIVSIYYRLLFKVIVVYFSTKYIFCVLSLFNIVIFAFLIVKQTNVVLV